MESDNRRSGLSFVPDLIPQREFAGISLGTEAVHGAVEPAAWLLFLNIYVVFFN